MYFSFKLIVLTGILLGLILHIPRSFAAVPNAITDLSANVGYDRVNLTWTTPGNGGSTITGYDYQQDGGSWTAIPNSDATTSSYIVTDLTPGTSHSFRVRAKNSDGNGQNSNQVTVIPNKLVDGISGLSLDNYDFLGLSSVFSADGNTLFVGSVGDDTGGTDKGAVYIFTKEENTWKYDTKIADGFPNEFSLSGEYSFGSSLAISQDGNTLYIGANGNDTNGDNRGAVYIFTRNSSNEWAHDSTITSGSNGLTLANHDYFGSSLAISQDNNTLFVGAHSDDTGFINAGAVHIFTKTSGTWTHTSKITSGSNGLTLASSDSFGSSLAVSQDNNTLFVGAHNDDTGFSNAGAIHIFTMENGAWTHTSKIASGSNGLTLTGSDSFGSSLAFSSDGNIFFAGAYSDNTGFSNAGAVHIFTKEDGVWTHTSKIAHGSLGIMLHSGDLFGASLTFSPDREHLFIGSRDTDGKGAFHIFSTGFIWNNSTKTMSLNIDRASLVCHSDDFYVTEDHLMHIGEGGSITCTYHAPSNTIQTTTKAFIASQNHISHPNTDIGSLTIIPDETTAKDHQVDIYIQGETIVNGIGFGTGSNAEYLEFIWATTDTRDRFLMSNTEGHHIDAITDGEVFTIHAIENEESIEEHPFIIGLYNSSNTSLADDRVNIRGFAFYIEDNDAVPVFTGEVSDHVYVGNTEIDPLQLPSVETPAIYSVSTLPTGLEFNSANRTITGTPTVATETLVTYTATNVYGGLSVSQTFIIDIESINAFEDPILWLRADDYSGTGTWNSYNSSASLSASHPSDTQHRPTRLTNQINGFPTVNFDGTNDYMTLNLDSIKGNTSYAIFAATKVETSTGTSTFPILGSDDNASDLELFFGYNEVFSSTEQKRFLFSRDMSSTTDTVTLAIPNFAAANNDIIPSILFFESDTTNSQKTMREIRNGTAENTTTGAIVGTASTSFQDYLGRFDNSYAHIQLGDLIVYENELSNILEKQVQTYLALKYNIPLGDETEYRDSIGRVLYDGSLDSSAYADNTAGIGKDDASGLEVSSAKSRGDESIIEISSPSSLGDIDFLIWGNNGGQINNFNEVIVHGASAQIARMWKIVETGDVGTVTVTVDISDINFPGGSHLDDVVLMIGQDEALFESDIFTSTSVSDDILTFGGVEFEGVNYMTIGLGRSAEINLGGVFADLRFWLDADDETTLFTDNACTQQVQSDDAEIACWIDKSTHEHELKRDTGDCNERSGTGTETCDGPQLDRDSFFGRNSLYFSRDSDGSHPRGDLLLIDLETDDGDARWTPFKINWSDTTNTDQGDMTLFIVMQQGADPQQYWSFFSNGNTLANNKNFQIDIDGADHYRLRGLMAGDSAVTYEVIDDEVKLYAFTISDNGTLSLFSDGHFVAQETNIGDYGRDFDIYKINQNRARNQWNDMRIAEIIIYEEDVGLCSLKVASEYLGNKYSSAFGGGIPGGIDCRNVVLWHVVDGFSTITGGGIETIIDQGPLEYNVTQGTASNRPAFNDDHINQLDAMTFDGTDDFITSAGTNLTFGSNERHYFFVFDYDEDDGTFLSHGSTQGTGGEVNLSISEEYISIDLGGQVLGVRNKMTEGVHLLQFAYYNGGDKEGWYVAVDGGEEIKAKTTSGSAVTVVTPASNLTFGRSVDAGDYFSGTIAESVLYAANLPKKVIESTNTYFALRYGITIDSNQDYIDSNRKIIYETGGENADFLFDIAGFGFDNSQDLFMTSSASSNDDSIIRVTADEHDIADGEFLIWGNDNGLLQKTTQNLPNNLSARIERTWKFKKEGDVGLVDIALSTLNLELESTTTSDFKIIIDNDGDFTSGATILTANSFTSNVAQFNDVDIDDGDHFSIVANISDTSVDVIDGSDASIGSPEFSFPQTEFGSQESTGIIGNDMATVFVNNETSHPAWTLSIKASDSDEVWEGSSHSFDFNDPDGRTDSGDADTVGGQLTINPANLTITPSSGCSVTGLTRGTSTSFSEGATDSIVLLSSGATADADCSWELRGINMEQVLPENQSADEYSLDLILTIIAD